MNAEKHKQINAYLNNLEPIEKESTQLSIEEQLKSIKALKQFNNSHTQATVQLDHLGQQDKLILRKQKRLLKHIDLSTITIIVAILLFLILLKAAASQIVIVLVGLLIVYLSGIKAYKLLYMKERKK